MAPGQRGAEKIVEDIRALKIQGARRIAKAAVEALSLAAQKSKAKDWNSFYSDLLVTADNLAGARETEPMLRNFLDDLLALVRSMRGRKISEIKSSLASKQKEILDSMEASVARICYHGAEALPEKGGVLVHCHSTTLMSILKLAHKQGKKLKVYCTETRPRYQGRMSAVELANFGLDVTLIVDSAAAGVLASGKINAVLLGADALTSRGELLNKIGSYHIALAAKQHGVKVYSAAELHKYDTATEGGREEPIEMRDALELADGEKMLKEWKGAGLKVENPAFDKVPPNLISAFITEEGLVAPERLAAVAHAAIGKK